MDAKKGSKDMKDITQGVIEIECNGCSYHCCGQNPHLTPVLTPEEEERFRYFSRKVKTGSREMSLLAKKENGNCIFLDDMTLRCMRYDDRPLECRLHPFLLDFSRGHADVKLVDGTCQKMETLRHDMKKIKSFLSIHKFPEDWIKGYDSLENC